jgi:hypothetical protein
MVDEHAKHPQAAVIGGPVASAPDSGAFEHGLYFCEYGAFAPPVRNGPAPALTGANLCYKREALDEGRDLIGRGAWETFLHERWRRQEREMRLCEASVTFHNTMTRGAALRQRFHYGRGYAADRALHELGGGRFLYALLSPLLPLVLTARSARQAFAKGRGGAFARALGWVVVLQTAWSLGEAVGYFAGSDPKPRIF